MNPLLKHYLNNWYSSDAGKYFADEVQATIDELLSEIFGYYAIQLGEYPPRRDLLASSRVNSNFTTGVLQPDVFCSNEQLPFATDAIDLLVLPHSLELSSDPHAILREVDRLLVPEGHLIIIGFNPLTAWGVLQLGRFRKNYPFYRAGRVKEWLSVLGFEYMGNQYSQVNSLELPIPARLNKHHLVSLAMKKLAHRIAGGYVILAQKKMTTITPIRPRWKFKPSLVNTGLTEPTTRKISRICQK